jgi:hypothetical protein
MLSKLYNKIMHLLYWLAESVSFSMLKRWMLVSFSLLLVCSFSI